MSGAEIIVSQWSRNGRETVIVKLSEYQGNAVIDIRSWYDNGDGLRPGRSGITLAVRHLPQLAESLTKALAMTDMKVSKPTITSTTDAETASDLMPRNGTQDE